MADGNITQMYKGRRKLADGKLNCKCLANLVTRSGMNGLRIQNSTSTNHICNPTSL